MKKTAIILLCFLLVISASGCTGTSSKDNEKIQIVTTIFPLYDFARQVAGNRAEVTLLLPTGAEVHSYEPTAKDVISIKESDLFIYLGMDADPWADAVVNDADGGKVNSLAVMSSVEDIFNSSHKGHTEIDPHIWTSLDNAEDIVESICRELSKIDTVNAHYYKSNAERYEEKLSALDEKFENLTDDRHITMVFADRFPFRYFADEYDIRYLAAFPGCSSESEPSAAAVSEIIDTIKKEKIPVVFYTETSNGALANTIREETGAEKVLFHSCHTVTEEELKNGITYLRLMEQNYEALKAI